MIKSQISNLFEKSEAPAGVRTLLPTRPWWLELSGHHTFRDGA